MAVSPQSTINEAEQRLRQSAIRLFAERGYAATSIREIIEDAGVTRPVLYYYFKNKEALFSDLVERQFEDVCDALDDIIASEQHCEKRLKLFARMAFDGTNSAPQMVQMLLHFFFSPPIAGLTLDKEELGRRRFERVMRIMRDGIARGELAYTNPEQLALMFTGIVDMAVMAWVAHPNSPLSDEMADALVTTFLNGAATRRIDTNVQFGDNK